MGAYFGELSGDSVGCSIMKETWTLLIPLIVMGECFHDPGASPLCSWDSQCVFPAFVIEVDRRPGYSHGDLAWLDRMGTPDGPWTVFRKTSHPSAWAWGGAIPDPAPNHYRWNLCACYSLSEPSCPDLVSSWYLNVVIEKTKARLHRRSLSDMHTSVSERVHHLSASLEAWFQEFQ